MRRRDFLLAAGALPALPLQLSAQPQARPAKIGYLSAQRTPVSFENDPNGQFVRAMKALGYIDGRSFVMEWRFADAEASRLSKYAQELVDAKVDVIVATTRVAVKAAQQATREIPIVITVAANPVTMGLVSSLANTKGNTTGVSSSIDGLTPKLLELLTTFRPGLARATYLWGFPNETRREEPNYPFVAGSSLDNFAKGIGVRVRSIFVGAHGHINEAFASMKDNDDQAVVVSSNPFLNERRALISSLALSGKLLSISPREEFAEAGTLMSYGESLANFYKRAALYVDKILKGAKPSDLPVELPNKLDLVVNQKTADALGLPIPEQLQILAERIIE